MMAVRLPGHNMAALLFPAALLSAASTACLSADHARMTSVVRTERPGIGGKTLKEPQGIFVDADRGRLLIADTANDRVVVTTLSGILRFAFNAQSPIDVAANQRIGHHAGNGPHAPAAGLAGREYSPASGRRPEH